MAEEKAEAEVISEAEAVAAEAEAQAEADGEAEMTAIGEPDGDRTLITVIHDQGRAALGDAWPGRLEIFQRSWGQVLEALARYVGPLSWCPKNKRLWFKMGCVKRARPFYPGRVKTKALWRGIHEENVEDLDLLLLVHALHLHLLRHAGLSRTIQRRRLVIHQRWKKQKYSGTLDICVAYANFR